MKDLAETRLLNVTLAVLPPDQQALVRTRWQGIASTMDDFVTVPSDNLIEGQAEYFRGRAVGPLYAAILADDEHRIGD